MRRLVFNAQSLQTYRNLSSKHSTSCHHHCVGLEKIIKSGREAESCTFKVMSLCLIKRALHNTFLAIAPCECKQDFLRLSRFK